MGKSLLNKMVKITTTLTLAGGLVGGSFGVNEAEALTFSSDVGVSFTFNSMIQVNLSGADLRIDDLAPGAASDSNIITVGATTNAVYGYQLSATVGVKNGTDALVNTTDNTKTFANLTGNKAGLANFEDNTWGYSYCADTAVNCGAGGSATWVSGSVGSATAGYNGLPLDNNDNASERGQGGVTLISTENTADSTQAVQFKIGAKASNAQVAGEYTNTINFYAVANLEPMTLAASYAAANKTQMNGYYKLQDMDTSICSAAEAVDDELQVIDTRDGKVYWIAKLADGHCWMTQNLDFDIVDGGADLDSTNTDIPNDWADAWYLTDTYATDDTTWGYYTDQPESYDPGDLCWNRDLDIYGSTTLDDGTEPYCDDRHYHIGNYYNWTAAVVMSDSSSFQDDGVDVDQSVCPAGWRLPNYDGAKDYSNLASTLSLTSGDGGNIHEEPVYFVYGGYWSGFSRYVGSYGVYWSSVVGDVDNAYSLHFSAGSYLDPQNRNLHSYGYSVRCVAR